MDEQLLKTWNDVADGRGDDVDVHAIQRKLIYICFDKAGDPDPEERLKALKVAAHFTVDDRMRLADPMIRDQDARVRRYAFNLAVEAKKDGITTLKTCVGSHDGELAAEAVALLVTQVDVTSSLHARQWLHSDFPMVRAGAAMLLGSNSGQAMSVSLGRMAQNDPVYGVRQIAAEAARRCAGEIPKMEARNFWEAGPTPIVLVEEPVRAAPTPVPAPPKREVPPVIPPPPRLDTSRLPTLYPESESTAPPPTKQLVPAVPAGTPEDVRDTPRDWRDPAPLPAAMPTEPNALLRLIGRVGAGDRAAVLQSFLGHAEADRSKVLRNWTPGSNPALGRGIALMIAALEDNRQASMLRHMLTDADAGVRAGAAEAVGAVGSLSMIPPLANLLADGDPAVRAAAVRGLARLLTRTERFAMLRERVQPLTSDQDASVRKAAEDALAAGA